MREVLIALEELSHRRNNRLIQTDGMALDLDHILPSNSTIFTVETSDELPTLNVKLGIGENFGFIVERRNLMQFHLVYFNGTPANDLRWYNSHGLHVSFVIRDDVGSSTTTDLSITTPPPGRMIAVILQIVDSATRIKTARFIIDFATFVGRATVREVVHAQCSLHCVTGIEGEYYDQHGVNIHPARSVAAGMAVRHLIHRTTNPTSHP